MKVLLIEWHDATGNAGWMNPSEVAAFDFSAAKVTTIGILVAENKTAITVTHTLSHGGYINGYITIPKAWISKRKTLSV